MFVRVNLVVTKYNAERRILHGSYKGGVVTHTCTTSNCGSLAQARSHEAGSYAIFVYASDAIGRLVALDFPGKTRGETVELPPS